MSNTNEHNDGLEIGPIPVWTFLPQLVLDPFDKEEDDTYNNHDNLLSIPSNPFNHNNTRYKFITNTEVPTRMQAQPDLVSSYIPVRGPGRPRKYPKIEEKPKITQAKPYSVPSPSNMPASSGRECQINYPKITKKPEIVQAKTDSVPSTSNVPARGRGRPRKYPKITKKPEILQAKPKSSTTSNSNLLVRGRGRARKRKYHKITKKPTTSQMKPDSVTSTSSTSTSNVPARGPGRPRKYPKISKESAILQTKPDLVSSTISMPAQRSRRQHLQITKKPTILQAQPFSVPSTSNMPRRGRGRPRIYPKITNEPTKPPRNKPVQCPHCPETRIYPSSLRIHVEKHVFGKVASSYDCQFCDARFNDKHILSLHNRRVHYTPNDAKNIFPIVGYGTHSPIVPNFADNVPKVDIYVENLQITKKPEILQAKPKSSSTSNLLVRGRGRARKRKYHKITKKPTTSQIKPHSVTSTSSTSNVPARRPGRPRKYPKISKESAILQTKPDLVSSTISMPSQRSRRQHLQITKKPTILQAQPFSVPSTSNMPRRGRGRPRIYPKITNEPTKPPRNKPVQCPHCPETRIYPSSLRIHVEKHVFGEVASSYDCQFCDARFNDKHILSVHNRRVHYTPNDTKNIFPIVGSRAHSPIVPNFADNVPKVDIYVENLQITKKPEILQAQPFSIPTTSDMPPRGRGRPRKYPKITTVHIGHCKQESNQCLYVEEDFSCIKVKLEEIDI